MFISVISSVIGRSCLRFLIGTLSVALLLSVHTARGQGLEVGGGWSHVTGDFGTDGFNVGAAWWFTNRVTIAGDYDSSWDTSSLSNFAFTQVGAIATKGHLQTFVLGPRVFFSTNWTNKHKLIPFGEAQFGVSHLNQKVEQVNMPTISASDSGFTWMLGGGAEYLFSPRWSGRANLDFLRTHLSNEAQSRLRLVLGVRYTFGGREEKIATSTPTSMPPPTRPTQVTASAKLIELEQRWAEALQRADLAALENILADTYIDADDTGHRTDKRGLMAALASKDLDIKTIKISGAEAYEHGDTAIVTGRATQDGTFKGQALADSVVFTNTFVRQGIAWKAISSHRSASRDSASSQ
jgi:hypothetical protein